MTNEEVQKEAEARSLGRVHFQYNTARNTGQQFEVGYVFHGGERILFCKRQPSAAPDAFYLCNGFRGA